MVDSCPECGQPFRDCYCEDESPRLEDGEDLWEAGCGPWTDVCLQFRCQTWEGDKIVRPVLAPDRNDFWCCPKCGGSYGRKHSESPNQ